MQISKKFIAGAVMASSIALPLATNAQTVNATGTTSKNHPFVHAARPGFGRNPEVWQKGARPGMKGTEKMNFVLGTVASINGATLTVTGANGTSYTVDASQAKLAEGMATSLTLASVQVGDKISASGTLTGTTLTANTVRDSSLLGRSIFFGSITAINGSNITLTGRNKTTYTVDASQASLVRPQRPTTSNTAPSTTTLSLSDLKTGDHLTVVGTLNGTSISASKVSDMGQFNRGSVKGAEHFAGRRGQHAK